MKHIEYARINPKQRKLVQHSKRPIDGRWRERPSTIKLMISILFFVIYTILRSMSIRPGNCSLPINTNPSNGWRWSFVRWFFDERKPITITMDDCSYHYHRNRSKISGWHWAMKRWNIINVSKRTWPMPTNYSFEIVERKRKRIRSCFSPWCERILLRKEANASFILGWNCAKPVTICHWWKICPRMTYSMIKMMWHWNYRCSN